MRKYMGYIVGGLVAGAAVTYSNFIEYDFNFNYFMLDLCFGFVFAYSVGLLFEAVAMFFYLRKLKMQ